MFEAGEEVEAILQPDIPMRNPALFSFAMTVT
jgi:hypothetical protein